MAPSTDTVAGLSITDKLDIYQQGTIRQVILYYSSEQYDPLLTRMRDIMTANGLESNSELLLWLVAQYEASAL